MVLGITGNIASGKSSITAEFKRLGAAVVDADRLAREVVEPGSQTLATLVETFGCAILSPDGSLNREALGQIVFSSAEARQQLNTIIHPAIAELASSLLDQLRLRRDLPLIVYDAPLLFEAGAEGRVDKVLVVKIDPEIQRQRLFVRDRLSHEDGEKRIAAQMSQSDKLKRADYIIDNSGTRDEMKAQVVALWKEIVG